MAAREQKPFPTTAILRTSYQSASEDPPTKKYINSSSFQSMV